MFLKRPLFQMLLATAILGLALWLGVKWFLDGTHEFSSTLDMQTYGRYVPEESKESSSAADDSGTAEGSLPMGIATGKPLTIADIQRHEAVLKEQQNSTEEPAEEDDSEVVDDVEVIAVVEPEEGSMPDAASGEDDSKRSSYLSDEELEARSEARRERLAELGLIQETPRKSTTAVDVSLLLPEQCKGAVTAKVPIGVKYRYESSIIRGESLNALESMVALYRLCEQGNFVVAENPLDFEDATPTLTQMRFDEVKYFFIQHRISIDAVQFPEKQ